MQQIGHAKYSRLLSEAFLCLYADTMAALTQEGLADTTGHKDSLGIFLVSCFKFSGHAT